MVDGEGSKINFLFLDKVFTTTESSGHFIFCLNDVLILTYFSLLFVGGGQNCFISG